MTCLANNPEEFAKEAVEGAKKIAEFAATKGRAHNPGEASIGTPDPGASSFAMLMGEVVSFL